MILMIFILVVIRQGERILELRNNLAADLRWENYIRCHPTLPRPEKIQVIDNDNSEQY